VAGASNPVNCHATQPPSRSIRAGVAWVPTLILVKYSPLPCASPDTTGVATPALRLVPLAAAPPTASFEIRAALRLSHRRRCLSSSVAVSRRRHPPSQRGCRRRCPRRPRWPQPEQCTGGARAGGHELWYSTNAPPWK
jgi:hypothetical protein